MFPHMLGVSQSMPGEQFMNSYYPFIIAIVIGFFFGIRHYFRGPQCGSVGDLKGKVVIVTGANSGIGFELTKFFCEHGAKVYIGCRSTERAEESIDAISKLVPHASIHPITLDLSSLHSVSAFAAAFLKRESTLHTLVNNAGVLAPEGSQHTSDALEVHFQVNYLGHFLLTHLLLDVLKDTPNSRVVNNTSHAHKLVTLQLSGLVPKTYLSHPSLAPLSSDHPPDNHPTAVALTSDGKDGDTMKDAIISTQLMSKNNSESVSEKQSEQASDESADDRANDKNRCYAQSKLALAMFTLKLSSLLQASHTSPVVLLSNPGVVFTDIYRTMVFRQSFLASLVATPFMWYLSKTSRDGAQTALHCCTHPHLVSGSYFVDCAEQQFTAAAKDEVMLDRLYDVSCEVCRDWMP